MTKSVKITPDGKILEVTEEEEERSKKGRVWDGRSLLVPEHWGNRKTIRYLDSFDLNVKTFKPYTVFLWLSSDKSVNDPQNKFDGSEVVIVWTIEDLFTFSVNSLIEDGIKGFDWENNSENYLV